MLKVEHYAAWSNERAATVRVTVHLTANEIASALVDDQNMSFGADDDGPAGVVDVSEKAIREAVHALVQTGSEFISYRQADNNTDDLVDQVTERVVRNHFDGERYQQF